ncbi:MAG: glycosyltransferase, partial [Mariprofundaceae bacterium]|nr:glycosyltransferase [Mariprofundaceae bacterium]
MDILHVNMSLDPVTGGGTVERIRQLHEAMGKITGITSRVLSVAISDSSALPESESVVLLPCWSKRWYLPAPKLLIMYRMVRQADVIHLMNHWTIINAVIYCLARMTGTSYVVCPAGALSLFGRSQGFKRWYNRLIGNALVTHASAAIAIAEDEVTVLKQYEMLEERIQNIPNGVRLEDFTYVDSTLFRKHACIGDADYLLFVGRLNPIKGPDLLLEAFIILANTFSSLHLVFTGPDGGMLNSLQSRVNDVALTSRVHFAGYAGSELKSSAYHGA